MHAKIMKPWQMMENTFPYSPSRNKNFSMHTPWDKNFLLTQNTNFSTKNYFSPPQQAKIFLFVAHDSPFISLSSTKK